MMRQLSIRSTGTMEIRRIPLYASKRLTSEPPDRGEVYRHIRLLSVIRHSKSRFSFQRRNN